MAHPAPKPGPPPLPVRSALRDVGSHVRSWRKLRGLTQAQLADRANVGRVTVARLEGGDGSVSIEIALRIFHALGVVEDVIKATDPYETDLGRMRADEQLPQRVRPRDLRRTSDDG